MEKTNYRKVIQLGKTTHCISLPKAWLEKYCVERGDTVLVDSKPNGDLIIIPNSQSQIQESEITINTKNKKPEEIKRNTIAAYINNYTEINVIGENVRKQLTNINKILELLPATEIMDVKKDSIIIKVFFDANNTPIKNVITRLNMLTVSLFTHIKDVLINNGKDYEFLKRENQINRLCFMGFRILSHASNNPHKTYLKDERNFLSTWMLIDQLEKIADRLCSLGRILKSSKNLQNAEKSCKKNVIQLISGIESAYKTSLLSFYKNDRAVAHKIVDMCQENSKSCNKRLVNCQDKYVVLALEKLDRISTITKHIGMVIIDQKPID